MVSFGIFLVIFEKNTEMVDLSFLKKFTKGNKDKMVRYINMYLRIAPATFKEVEQHLRQQDWKQVRIKAHSLKPQAEYMGIANLKSTLEQIESSIEKEAFQQIPDLCRQAFTLHKNAVPQLKAFLDTL